MLLAYRALCWGALDAAPRITGVQHEREHDNGGDRAAGRDPTLISSSTAAALHSIVKPARRTGIAVLAAARRQGLFDGHQRWLSADGQRSGSRA